MDEICYKPIGVVHSPYVSPAQTPRQPRMSLGTEGSVQVFDQYAAGLAGLAGFSPRGVTRPEACSQQGRREGRIQSGSQS
mgnify:CR=1 FL=1